MQQVKDIRTRYWHMVQFIISHWNARYLQEAIKLDIVEIGLASHVEKFLIEMEAGFAFMGRQYHIEVSGDDYSRGSLPTIEEIEKELKMKQFSNKFFKEPIYTCKNTKKMANRKVS